MSFPSARDFGNGSWKCGFVFVIPNIFLLIFWFQGERLSSYFSLIALVSVVSLACVAFGWKKMKPMMRV